jgi:lysophospholipase L1-like esterase
MDVVNMIHVIGDSHSESFRGYPGFTVHFLGSATAHNLIKDNSITHSKQKTLAVMSKIPNNEVVLFVLGEIDCRLHIYQKYMDTNEAVPIEKLISTTVERYIGFLKQFKDHRVVVSTIPPAGYEEKRYEYPFYGSPKIRGYINKTFNEALREECSKAGTPCVDIYDKVVREDGLAKQEYLRDQVHFNYKAIALIVEELRRQKLMEKL